MFILFLIQELEVAEIRQEPFLLFLCLVSVSGLTCTTTGKHAFVAFLVEIRPGSLLSVTATCQPLVCVQPAKLPLPLHRLAPCCWNSPQWDAVHVCSWHCLAQAWKESELCSSPGLVT